MVKNLLDVIGGTNEVPPDGPPIQQPIPTEGGGQLDEFFADMEWIQKEIEKIRSETSQVRTKQSELLSAPQQNPQTKAELEELSESIKRSAAKMRMKLKLLEKSIQEPSASGDSSSAYVRMRVTQHSAMTRRFMDVMGDYNTAQIAYRDANKARIKTQLQIAQRSVTDEELEEMLESGTPQIFTQGIITDTQQARQNLADIEARHEDIMKLEKSIRELRDLFIDMAALVESQGDLIDRIDHNVLQTKDHISDAAFQTSKALVYKKKSRKKKFIIIGVCVGVLVLILIIVLASLLRGK